MQYGVVCSMMDRYGQVIFKICVRNTHEVLQSNFLCEQWPVMVVVKFVRAYATKCNISSSV